jgi:integrase
MEVRAAAVLGAGARVGARTAAKPRALHTRGDTQGCSRSPATWIRGLDLLLALGAELRGGQVHRAMRSHLQLEEGRFVVWSRGKKRGATVELTAGQQASVRKALAGYLVRLEERYIATSIDYPLFPAGQMPGGRKGTPVADPERHMRKPMTMRAMLDRHREAEERAGIPHIAGRALYGMRRSLLDAASEEGISREGMKQHGGWANLQVPDSIYRDQEQLKAREEAKAVRAKIRRETP